MGTDKTSYSNGKSRTQRTAEKRQSRRDNYRQRPAFDIMALETKSFVLCIEQIVAKQGAIRIGLSRDGGALAIGIYGDGEPYTEYIEPNADIDEYFNGLAEHFANL